jgi:hypothetical protein
MQIELRLQEIAVRRLPGPTPKARSGTPGGLDGSHGAQKCNFFNLQNFAKTRLSSLQNFVDLGLQFAKFYNAGNFDHENFRIKTGKWTSPAG